MPEGTSLPLGVVQSLTNHEPGVDTVYRVALSAEEGEVPLDFAGRGAGVSEEWKKRDEKRDASLDVVPEFVFTPYNSEVTNILLAADT